MKGASTDRKRQAVRWVWRLIRWPLAVLALLVAVLVAINGADKELSAQAQAMLQSPPNPYADADNLYVLLAGIDAPEGRSPLIVGQANIAAYRLAVVARSPLRETTAANIGRTPESEQLKVTPEMPDWDTLESSVWNRSRSSRAEISEWTSANRVLLDRYNALQSTQGYHEDALRSSLELFYLVPRRLRALYLASIASAVQSEGSAEQLAALRSLEADAALWRRMLRGEGTLISKMLATVYLHADLILLADMIEDRTVPLDQLQKGAPTLLVPWPADTWKIGKVFPAEFRFFSAAIAEMSHDSEHGPYYRFDGAPNWVQRRWNDFGRMFLKQHATLNLRARLMERLADASDTDPAHYSQRARAYLDWLESLPSRRLPALLYNPVGKTLPEVTERSYTQYPLRTYDVAAFQRLVVLAHQLRTNGVAPENVPAFMAAHPESSTHLVDRLPFVWDAATGTIRVIQSAPARAGRRFSIRVASAGTTTGAR